MFDCILLWGSQMFLMFLFRFFLARNFHNDNWNWRQFSLPWPACLHKSILLGRWVLLNSGEFTGVHGVHKACDKNVLKPNWVYGRTIQATSWPMRYRMAVKVWKKLKDSQYILHLRYFLLFVDKRVYYRKDSLLHCFGNKWMS